MKQLYNRVIAERAVDVIADPKKVFEYAGFACYYDTTQGTEEKQLRAVYIDRAFTLNALALAVRVALATGCPSKIFKEWKPLGYATERDYVIPKGSRSCAQITVYDRNNEEYWDKVDVELAGDLMIAIRNCAVYYI